MTGIENKLIELENIRYEQMMINTLYLTPEFNSIILDIEREIEHRINGLRKENKYTFVKTTDLIKRLQQLHKDQKEYKDLFSGLSKKLYSLKNEIQQLIGGDYVGNQSNLFSIPSDSDSSDNESSDSESSDSESSNNDKKPKMILESIEINCKKIDF